MPTSLSSIALFLVLGGGTAVALNGANTVFSDDIVNGQVKSDDLAKLSFTAVKPNPQLATDPCDSGEVGIFCAFVGSAGYRGWKNLGQGYANVAYARDGLGIVHLQGAMWDPGPAARPRRSSCRLGTAPPQHASSQSPTGVNSSSSPTESVSMVRVLTNGEVVGSHSTSRARASTGLRGSRSTASSSRRSSASQNVGPRARYCAAMSEKAEKLRLFYETGLNRFDFEDAVQYLHPESEIAPAFGGHMDIGRRYRGRDERNSCSRRSPRESRESRKASMTARPPRFADPGRAQGDSRDRW